MKLLLTILILIVFLCSGCAEYLHAPDEISIGANISESNFGIQGRPVTTGAMAWATWYREKNDK